MLIGLLYIKYDAWVNAEVIHTEIVKIPNTWDEYKEDCGTEVLTKNALKYSWNFENKYQSKTINWDGYFMKATDFSSTWFHGDHSYTVLIKMANSETDIHADLILSFDDSARRDSKVVLDSLEKGNHVQFEATFITAGNEYRLHHLHCEKIEKLEGHMEIPEHVHLVSNMYNTQGQVPVTVIRVQSGGHGHSH